MTKPTRAQVQYKATMTTNRANRKAAGLGIPGKLMPGDVITVWEFTNWRCIYCNAGAVGGRTRFGIDHVVPFSKGGENKITNIVPCCHSCNCLKWTLEVSEFLRDYGRSVTAFQKRFNALQKHIEQYFNQIQRIKST